LLILYFIKVNSVLTYWNNNLNFYVGSLKANEHNINPTLSSEWDYEVEIPSNYCARKIQFPDKFSVIVCDR